MGKKVLSTYIEASSDLRAYAHCTKRREGVTLLLINLSNSTTYEIKVHNTMNRALHVPNYSIPKQGSLKNKFKKAFSWAGSKASDQHLYREEYRLTPKDEFKQSQIILLNGKQLSVSEHGDIPHLEPAFVNAFSPIHISPLSITFMVLPKFEAPTCWS
uniref:Beta-glucuronidase n=1 Tax=Opuntia streptacantha TaxID=393608 RepID=A0A7C9CQY1_OPUST